MSTPLILEGTLPRPRRGGAAHPQAVGAASAPPISMPSRKIALESRGSLTSQVTQIAFCKTKELPQPLR
jgi:hypothetical protein